MNARVSVLMSTYNEPLYWLKESIDSILNQTFSDFEFVLINDNPGREDLKGLLEFYGSMDKRIKLVHNSENLGLTGTFNTGIDHCSEKYIARMDADDVALPNRFQIQFDFMENNPEVGVCGSFVETFGAKKRILTVPVTDQEIRDNIIDRCPFIHPTVFIRNTIFSSPEIRYKDESAEDYGLWVNLLNKTKFHNIDKVLLKYRISKLQFSYNNPKQKKAAQKVKKRAIHYVFGEKVSNELFDGEAITLKKIKKIKQLISAHMSNKARDVFIETLYLSQNKYGIYAAMHYLIAERKPKASTFLKLIKRIFKHNALNSRIDVKC